MGTISLPSSDLLAESPHDERDTIDACRQGDMSAFERVYREHASVLLGVARRMLGTQEDAEDAVQMTLVRFHRGVAKYRSEAKLETYLVRILINVCYDALAKRQKVAALPLEPEHGVVAERTDLRVQLEEAILTLPDRMRACFVLFAVEGYAQKEIADMLDVRLGTVKAQIFQAKERLRALLTDEEESS